MGFRVRTRVRGQAEDEVRMGSRKAYNGQGAIPVSNPLICAICGKEIREAERYVNLPDGKYAHRECART